MTSYPAFREDRGFAYRLYIDMWDLALLPVFATLFLVIDPPGLVPMFLVLTEQHSESRRIRIALRAVLVALCVLLPFALLGDTLFTFMGVSLPAFRIAGGILLFLIAVDMLFEKRTERRERKVEEASAHASDDGKTPEDVSVFPLGIPLIAGPGTIATIILLMSEHEGNYASQVMVIGVLVFVLALTLALFVLAAKLHRFINPTLTKVLTRVFGMILSALAVQFVLTGLQDAGIV